MASIKIKKEQDAKEKRKEEREKKAAEKKKEAAAKKKQTQLRKKRRAEEMAAKECAKKKSKGKKGKEKLFKQLLRAENECQKCGGVYDLDERWIGCGKDVDSDEESHKESVFDNGWGLWFYVRCTDLGPSITDEELEEINWLCETCI